MIDGILYSVLNHYHDEHDLQNLPILVDNLKPYFEAHGYADRITFYEAEFDGRFVRAQIAFYDRSTGVYGDTVVEAEIHTARNMNMCEKRFVLCKELYHTILDRMAEDRVSGLDNLHKLTEYLVDDSISAVEGFSPYGTEKFAELLAIETLFPYELRCGRINDEYTKGTISAMDIALEFRIPEAYIKVAMSKNYMETIARVRGDKLLNVFG